MKTSLAAILCILFSFNVFACASEGKPCGMSSITGKSGECCGGHYCNNSFQCARNP